MCTYFISTLETSYNNIYKAAKSSAWARLGIMYVIISYTYLQIDDGTGQTRTRLVIWKQPGNDVSGIVARSAKVIHTCEKVEIHKNKRIMVIYCFVVVWWFCCGCGCGDDQLV